MRDDRERLLDILEAIERIERHASVGRLAFEQDELIQTWIIHHLMIIGETASGLSEVLRDEHPQIPWSSIVGMRNALIHGYFGIDLDAVWAAVERDLPELKHNVSEILEQ